MQRLAWVEEAHLWQWIWRADIFCGDVKTTRYCVDRVTGLGEVNKVVWSLSRWRREGG